MLLKLLGEAPRRRHGHGADRARGPLPGARRRPRVVATGYGPGDEALARLGVVGPTRMDYPGRWRRCAPWPATSPGSSTKADPPHAERLVSQDLLRRLLGVARDADADDDQEGLPQAGPPAAPRRQPGPGDRRSGSRRSPGPTRCSPTRRSGGVRPRRRPVRRRRPAASARARASRSPTSWTPSSAARPVAARRPAAARARGPGAARTR